jgi:hypothetical protein
MRVQSPSPTPLAPSADPTVPGPDEGPRSDSPAGAEPAPANRAARRGRAKGHADQGAARTGSPVRPRAAQGRRVNPVRRTG